VKGAAWLTLGVLLWATRAEAEPTLWQRVVQPEARNEARARLRAEQLFDQSSEASADDSELLRELSRGSAALLTLSGGAKRDPWQQVLLGRVLLDAQPGREREAISLISRGVVGLPDSDFKRASLFDLGIGSLVVGDMELAERAFTAALALAWDPDYRARLHRNRSKVRMLSGKLAGAVADARVAVRLARGTELVALSHFGLGVALERSGDYPAGIQEIARGVAVRLPVPPYHSESVLELPTLRWVPEYDVHYYRALAAMSEATAADLDPDSIAVSYEAALVDWEQYLLAAEAFKDRFAVNARRHQQRCLEALARLRKGHRSPPPASRRGR
jgi:tetratricopeptide (TPR) repeat protein